MRQAVSQGVESVLPVSPEVGEVPVVTTSGVSLHEVCLLRPGSGLPLCLQTWTSGVQTGYFLYLGLL